MRIPWSPRGGGCFSRAWWWRGCIRAKSSSRMGACMGRSSRKRWPGASGEAPMDNPDAAVPSQVIPEAISQPPILAVLFDCDGTLIDSEDLGNEVLLELVREHGIPLSQSEARSGFR